MKNVLSLFWLQCCFAKILYAGDESDSSPPDFDWTDFLVNSPTHSSPQQTSNEVQYSAQTIKSNNTPLHVSSATLTKSKKWKTLSTSDAIDKAKLHKRYKQTWEREKARFETATPKAKEELLSSKRARQAKHRRTMKQKFGHTSKYGAHFAQLVVLEQNGNANEEQLRYLREERAKNRAKQTRKREKQRDKLKRENQQKQATEHTSQKTPQ